MDGGTPGMTRKAMHDSSDLNHDHIAKFSRLAYLKVPMAPEMEEIKLESYDSTDSPLNWTEVLQVKSEIKEENIALDSTFMSPCSNDNYWTSTSRGMEGVSQYTSLFPGISSPVNTQYLPSLPISALISPPRLESEPRPIGAKCISLPGADVRRHGESIVGQGYPLIADTPLVEQNKIHSSNSKDSYFAYQKPRLNPDLARQLPSSLVIQKAIDEQYQSREPDQLDERNSSKNTARPRTILVNGMSNPTTDRSLNILKLDTLAPVQQYIMTVPSPSNTTSTSSTTTTAPNTNKNNNNNSNSIINRANKSENNWLENGLNSCKNSDGYKCKVCGACLRSLVYFIRHAKMHNDRVCVFCKVSYSSAEHLDEHLTIHFGKMFICTVCDEKFDKPHMLNSHLNSSGHKMNYRFRCNHCNRTFKREMNLIRHREEHSRYAAHTCDFCNSRLPNKQAYLQHMETCQIAREASIISKNEILTCLMCDEIFNNVVAFKGHMSRHKNTHNSMACLQCEKVFMTNQGLLHHSIGAHSVPVSLTGNQTSPLSSPPHSSSLPHSSPLPLLPPPPPPVTERQRNSATTSYAVDTQIAHPADEPDLHKTRYMIESPPIDLLDIIKEEQPDAVNSNSFEIGSIEFYSSYDS